RINLRQVIKRIAHQQRKGQRTQEPDCFARIAKPGERTHENESSRIWMVCGQVGCRPRANRSPENNDVPARDMTLYCEVSVGGLGVLVEMLFARRRRTAGPVPAIIH